MKTFVLRSPQGEIVKGWGLSKFAREHNLDNTELGKVVNGEIWQHRGWTRPDKTKKDFLRGSCGPFYLLSPEGEVVKGNNIGEFCEKFGLGRKYLVLLIRGHKKQYKGWTLPVDKQPDLH